MDWTTLQHSLIVVGLTAIGFFVGNPIAGCAAGVALVMTREHTQAEYRWIEKYGQNKRANMPWWGGFDPRVWDIGSLTDWLVPLIVCLILLFIF